MKSESQRIQELISYLIEAKKNQWTIDMGSLMQEYNLSIHQVRDIIGKVYL